ncbi:MAG: hypothetical protein AABX31_04615 [Nanoarchaeota archaeon]
MKISIVDGQKNGIKYIAAGSTKVVLVEDFGSNSNQSHYIEWKTSAQVEKILEVMERLYLEAHYDYDKEDQKIDEESRRRGMYVGRKDRDTILFHYQPDFWQHTNPLSQLEDGDIYLRMITPHYQMYCLNFHYKHGSEEPPLYIDETLLKKISKRPVKEGINRIEVITNFNLSSTLAELITATSPVFPEDKDTKAILTQKFDQLLTQYQKPTKFN